MPLDFFNSLEYLEPHCLKCNSVLDFGVNTHFDEKEGNHVCNKCNTVIKDIHKRKRPVLKVTDFDVQ